MRTLEPVILHNPKPVIIRALSHHTPDIGTVATYSQRTVSGMYVLLVKGIKFVVAKLRFVIVY